MVNCKLGIYCEAWKWSILILYMGNGIELGAVDVIVINGGRVQLLEVKEI